jgi:capsule polysaccharide export protein KpsE/RkpR
MEKPGIISVTLADIYYQQGYIEQSMEIYRELSKREPFNDFYKKKLISLKKDLKAKQKGTGFKSR